MKKSLLLTAALTLLSAGQLSARQLTASEALARLMGDKSETQTASRVRRAQAANKLKLVYTSEQSFGNSYYVYNNTKDGGFVLLSADDCLPTVLGISDKGSFDFEKIPTNMKMFLSIYDEAVKNGSSARSQRRKVISENEIAPLLGATEWDQMKPFNLEVPEYEYGKNGKEQAPVGCVACATAQIMRYHQHPASGTGEASYKFIWDTKAGVDKQVATDSTEFSTNFAEHTYDWANMIDKYTNDPVNWNEEQGKAVSVLLKDIGVAAKMRYGTEASGGSGTQTYLAMRGMVNHFGYDPSMQFVTHKYYTDDEWDNMIYAELSNSRPVMFGGNGANGSGGHEYVCDGFKDGKFHINWGWSGSNNGYFLLTGPGLVPGGSGSGGAGEGASYGYGQEAAIGIQPANGGSVSGSIATVGYTCKMDGLKLALQGKFVSQCYVQRRDSIGVQLQASDGTCYNFTDNSITSLGTTDDFSSIDVELKPIAEGEYTIVPIFKGEGEEWQQIKVLSTFKAATIKYENETFDVTNNDAPKIEAEGELTVNKKSFRPSKKKEDGTLDAEELILTCAKGIKNCDDKGVKISFGVEFFDLTASNDSIDVYWLSNMAKTNADNLAPGASVTEIRAEILEELEVGHQYEIAAIFYSGVDDSLDDDAYWDQLDAVAQYVAMPKGVEPPVIEIAEEEGEDVETAIKTAQATDGGKTYYDINGRAYNTKTLAPGVYIIREKNGVRKIVKK